MDRIERPSLGSPAWDSLSALATWNWERGWAIRLHGRRSGVDAWVTVQVELGDAEEMVCGMARWLEVLGRPLEEQ